MDEVLRWTSPPFLISIVWAKMLSNKGIKRGKVRFICYCIFIALGQDMFSNNLYQHPFPLVVSQPPPTRFE